MNKQKTGKILIGPSSFAGYYRTPLERLLSAGYEIIENPYKRKLTKQELLELLGEGVTGIIAGLEPFDREVLQKSSLKVISRVGSGLSNVDLETARELGIEVCYTPHGPTAAVAELTIGVIICLLRMIPRMDNVLHNGEWVKMTGTQVEGKTVAIIGFGRIGRRVAELLMPFKLNIIAVDPFLKEAVSDYEILKLEEALPLADIITIHSSGEVCILDEKEFALMKNGVYLLNSARGGIIAEDVLIRNLDSRKVAGAWLDTFTNEPYTGPLCKYENVILTPHIGSYTRECRKQMETEAAENLIAAFNRIKG